MSQDEQSQGSREAAESPTAWFAVLERARLTDDFELAAQAQRELARLGVVVRFHQAKKSRSISGGTKQPGAAT